MQWNITARHTLAEIPCVLNYTRISFGQTQNRKHSRRFVSRYFDKSRDGGSGSNSDGWVQRGFRGVWQGLWQGVNVKLRNTSTLWSGWERGHFLKRVVGGDEGDGPEPHRGRAQQHGDGGGPGRERHHRVPRVPWDDETKSKPGGPGGGVKVCFVSCVDTKLLGMFSSQFMTLINILLSLFSHPYF